jgi:YCII-related domain
MSRFLITYHGSEMSSDPATMEQAKAAFEKWVSEAGDALVDPGAPVRAVTQVSSGSPTGPVEIGGYSIIEAESEDAAIAVLKSHPFVARGGTLQVSQVLEV